MPETLSNFASSTLGANITNVQASLTVADGSLFPATGNFRIRIDDELILVGARAGNTLSSLTRGIESTTAAAHTAPVAVRHVLTATGLHQAVADPATEDRVFNSFHVMGPNPWVDVEKKHGLVVGAGASGTDQENNADGINAAIADNWELKRRLLLPPAVVHVAGQSVGYTASADTSAELEIMGFGWDSSMIWQRDAALPGMKIETTGGNLRRLHMHDFTIRNSDPSYNLELLKCGYNIFERLLFWTGGGVHVGTSSFQNVIRDCWWLNSAGNAILVDTSSEATFENPLIGEGGGAVYVNAATLRIRGGQMRQFVDRIDADGPNAMGKSYFVVNGDGRLRVQGAQMAFCDQASGTVMCALDSGTAVFEDNSIIVHDDTAISTFTLIKQRTMGNPQYFQLIGNTVACHDAGTAETLEIYDQFAATEPHDSIIADNTFLFGTNWTPKIEDTFLKPANNNVYANNTVKSTSGVTP